MEQNKIKIIPKMLLLLALQGFFLSSYGQETYSIKGTVIDATLKEGIAGASVKQMNTQNGTVTDIHGDFVLNDYRKIKKIRVSCVGYKDTILVISEGNIRDLKIILRQKTLFLNEVQVFSTKEAPIDRVNQMQMGIEKVSMREARLLPAILGEIDIIKVLQLKPGVKSAGEGNAGFFVRGGGNDQNLILVEHAPVYNPNHLFGFFSVFNSDAIKDVTLYKSGFPSQYGGRLSSVLDVSMNKGQADSLTFQGGLSIISARLSVNIPIIKNKASFLFSARRTFADLITGGINRLNRNTPNYSPIPAYSFYDYNAAFNFDLNQRNQISFNGYFGDDKFNFSGDNLSANLIWGNRSATIKWNHTFNKRLSVTNAVFLSGYLYRINNTFSGSSVSLGSSINDQGLVSNWHFDINPKHELKIGVSGIFHRFTVGDFGISSDFTDIKSGTNLNGTELGAYVSHNWKIDDKAELLSGLRNSTFITQNKTYNGIEPRVTFKYNLGLNTSVKTSYARMYQYLHLVTSSGASLPTDVWYPSEEGISPQRSDQVSLGLYQAVAQNKFFISVEGYYKWIKNAIDFRDGAQLFANPNLSKEFVFGKGWAYGLEAFIEKKKGKTTGWLGYTLAWTWRKFDKINNGEPFFPRYDRRHDISLVVLHKLNKRVHLSATWIYGTGNYATIAGGRFAYQDFLPTSTNEATPDYLRRNDFKMPSTHRLDLGLVLKLKNKRRIESDLTFSIYNAYSRRNPFFVRYQEVKNEKNEPNGFKPILVSLFPVLPTVTYNFKF